MTTKAGWRQIAESFRAQIEEGSLTEGAVIPSEADLAAQWSVSRMTIHRAMTELQELGLVTRKRRTGTRVAPFRREPASTPSVSQVSAGTHAERSAQTRAIALIIDDQKDRLALEYIRGVSTAVPDTHRLLFFNTQGRSDREAECLQLVQGQAEGIVLFPSGDPDNIPIIEGTIRAGIPIVALDRDADFEGISSVTSDNFGASLLGLRHLAERGHKRIAHFTWGLREEPEVTPVLERYDAWRTMMQENGASDPGRWLRRYPLNASSDVEHLTQFAQDAVFAMLHQPDPPTAIFCVNDYFMIALLQACSDLGVQVPDTLEILSFNDGIQLMPRQARAVNRLVQRTDAMGRRAMEMLLDQIHDRTRLPEHIRLPADFYPSDVASLVETT